MVKTELVSTSDLEKIEEELDNGKCTEDRLKHFLDYQYADDTIRFKIYKKVITHRNSTEELYRYIIELVGDSFHHMKEIYSVIAKYTAEESTLRNLLSCKYANTTFFFCSIAPPVLKNPSVTEDIIFDMLVDCFIFHSDTIFYYIDYPAFLSRVIKKTSQKKNLELAIALAIQNNICNSLEVFNTLFNLDKKISGELYIKALNTVLMEAMKFIPQLNSCELDSKKSLLISRISGIAKLLCVFVKADYAITINELKKIIDFSIATNNKELATLVAQRSECIPELFEKLLQNFEELKSFQIQNAE